MDNNVELTRRCLTLISRIAARAASSPDPDHVADTLMELSHALFERTGDTGDFGHRQARALHRMHRELDYIDSTSQGFTAYEVLKFATRNTWN